MTRSTGTKIDVSVRFRQGPYSYLQIIECRDKGRPTSRDEIAAFSKKVEKTKANKGVFVSAAGFQSGAMALAAEESIDIFTLREIPEDWASTVIAKLPISHMLVIRQLMVRIRGSVGFLQAPKGVHLPSVRFISPKGRFVSVHDALHRSRTIPADWAQRVGPWAIHVDLVDGEWSLPLQQAVPIDAFRVLLEAAPLPPTAPAKMPPEYRAKKIEYRNVASGAAQTFADRDIPFGLTTEVEADKFYTDISGREYYCESSDGDTVLMVLLADQQHGRRFFASFSATKEQTKGHYATIEDSAAVQRLKETYAEWLEAKRSGRLSSNFIANPQDGSILTDSDSF